MMGSAEMEKKRSKFWFWLYYCLHKGAWVLSASLDIGFLICKVKTLGQMISKDTSNLRIQ